MPVCSAGTIAPGTIAKAAGDAVAEDEVIAQIETDKVTIDVRAPTAGVITELMVSRLRGDCWRQVSGLRPARCATLLGCVRRVAPCARLPMSHGVNAD